MENQELKYIKGYAAKLNEGAGDLNTLTKEERHHLTLLIRKFELEQTLAQLAEELGQMRLL